MGLFSDNGQYSSDEIGHLEALYASLAQQYDKSSAVKVTYTFLPSFSLFPGPFAKKTYLDDSLRFEKILLSVNLAE